MNTLLRDLETPQLIPDLMRLAGYGNESARRQRAIEEQLKLSFHFGGLDVAYTRGRKGLVVVASGTGTEVCQVLDTLPEKERRKVIIMFPDPWEDVLHQYSYLLPPRPRSSTAAVTYGQIDCVLVSMGFTCQDVTMRVRTRVYEHAETGAIIYLPPFPPGFVAYPHHLATVRGTLENFGVADRAAIAAWFQKGG